MVVFSPNAVRFILALKRIQDVNLNIFHQEHFTLTSNTELLWYVSFKFTNDANDGFSFSLSKKSKRLFEILNCYIAETHSKSLVFDHLPGREKLCLGKLTVGKHLSGIPG